MKRIAWKTAVVILGFLLLPTAVFAQAAITGVVRDTSGGGAARRDGGSRQPRLD